MLSTSGVGDVGAKPGAIITRKISLSKHAVNVLRNP